jgi:alpha-L-fucosidase
MKRESISRHIVVIVVVGVMAVGQAWGASVNAETPQKAKPESLQAWRDAHFGMFIHWGPISLKGTEISWSRANSNPQCPNNGEIPVAVYDNLYKEFNPTKFNAKEWVATAKEAGMKYMVLTAKHCDGFLLWDSKVSDYNIMHTPFKRDVCAELAKAAHDAGMKLGWYFSPMDWRDPDCRSTNNAEFVKRMQAELAELLTNYGKIDVLWFDTDGKPAVWDVEKTYRLVRRLQPGIVINCRLEGDMFKIGPWADFATYEGSVAGFDFQGLPWETCMTIGTQWSWKPNDSIKSESEVVGILSTCVGNNGNLLLNVGPMSDGRIEPRQLDVLKGVGAWLAKNGEAIYATRGGPYRPELVSSTRKGNNVYLHVSQWKNNTLTLPDLPVQVQSAKLLGGGEVTMARENGTLIFVVAPKDHNPAMTVIKLTLAGSAEAIAPLSARLN